MNYSKHASLHLDATYAAPGNCCARLFFRQPIRQPFLLSPTVFGARISWLLFQLWLHAFPTAQGKGTTFARANTEDEPVEAQERQRTHSPEPLRVEIDNKASRDFNDL